MKGEHPEPMSQTNMSHMEITPRHAEVIDQVLQTVLAHLKELAPALGYGPPPPLNLEQMGESPLAKALRLIACYAEGYDLGEGDTLPHIRYVGRCLFAKPLGQQGYKFPTNFQKTPLGELISDAAARYFPRSQRITVSEARQILGVTRQTLHDWAQDGTLTPVYDQGQLTFLRQGVEQLQQKRAAGKKEVRRKWGQ